jgi:hypothetical protein
MKTLTLTILLVFSITSCSLNEQKFNCEGTGLVVSKSKSFYGNIELDLCEKSGTELTLYVKGENCSDKSSKSGFVFDEVTYKLIKLYDGSTITCKKM